MDTQKNIPDQFKGQQTDTSHSITLKSEGEAVDYFKIVKNRLLDVSNWHSLAGEGTADFQLTDSAGNPVNRTAQIGDHFKINIPAPGTITGEGNDWVQIESVEDASNPGGQNEYISVKVRPARNPNNADPETAHFFKDDATSTFIAKREGQTVSAEVHGRNETPNTKETGIVDTVRNAVVAVGAMLGFSKMQWKSLVKALIEKE